MVELEPGYGRTYRRTLRTNQCKKADDMPTFERYGAYACVFISLEFLRRILPLEEWPADYGDHDRVFLEKISVFADEAIDAGIKRHAFFCKKWDGVAKEAKPVLAAYKQSFTQEELVIMVNAHARAPVNKMNLILSPAPKSGFFDLVGNAYLQQFLEGQGKFLGERSALVYNTSQSTAKFMLPSGVVDKVFPSLGYIIGSQGHVVSIVRCGNKWLLFNSLPEVRHGWSITKFLYYAYGNGYVLLFSGVNATDNLIRYLQQKLWKPGSMADTYAFMMPKGA